MKRLILFALLLTIPLGPPAWASAGATARSQEAVTYKDGLVTVQEQDLPVMTALERLSGQASIHVFLFEPLGGERVQRTATGVPLDQFLGQVLKGHNHAVLYHPTAAMRDSDKSLPNPSEKPPRVSRPHEGAGSPTGEATRIRDAMQEDDRAASPQTDAPSRVHTLTGTTNRTQSPSRERLSPAPAESSAPSTAAKRDSGSNGVSAYGFSMASTEAAPAAVGSGEPSRASSTRTGRGMASASAPATESAAASPSSTSLRPSAPDPGTTPSERPAWTRKDQIQHIVNQLEKRIESGQSDRDYEKWASIKGEEYVTHDRELLAYYEQQLAVQQ